MQGYENSHQYRLLNANRNSKVEQYYKNLESSIVSYICILYIMIISYLIVSIPSKERKSHNIFLNKEINIEIVSKDHGKEISQIITKYIKRYFNNPFMISAIELKHLILKNFPWIDKFQIYSLPNKIIRIKLLCSKPIAIWSAKKSKTYFSINENGIIIWKCTKVSTSLDKDNNFLDDTEIGELDNSNSFPIKLKFECSPSFIYNNKMPIIYGNVGINEVNNFIKIKFVIDKIIKNSDQSILYGKFIDGRRWDIIFNYGTRLMLPELQYIDCINKILPVMQKVLNRYKLIDIRLYPYKMFLISTHVNDIKL